MELRQLRYFREVVRQGSYRRAAARLNITQPALSKSIRAMEAELGVQLLERGLHGVSPTPFGAILLDGADAIHRDLDRALDEIRALSDGHSGGTVRIGGMTTLMRWVLPPAVKRLATLDHRARVDVRIALVDDLFAMLESGKIDLAIGTFFPHGDSADLTRERLLTDRIVVVCNRQHPLRARNPSGPDAKIGLAELADHGWVVPGESDSWRQHLFAAFREAHLPAPNVAVETGSSALMAGVLESTAYLSLLPNAILETDPVFSHLAALEAEVDWPDFEVVLAYRRQAMGLPAIEACIMAIRDACQRWTPRIVDGGELGASR